MPKPLEAVIDIAAPPERVWAVLSDLKRMPEFSPNTIRMVALGKPRAGTWTINLNRDGRYYYPTTSRIVRFEPGRAFAFKMIENGTIWSYTLEPIDGGTRVTERRDIPNGVRKPVRVLIDAALGGELAFEQNLIDGMNTTLAKIKSAAEA
ncbi:SRPBCC family protein [Nocardia sp. CDC159]|uniref:SRPBCC family protein n=1 Tax=Nocardia pulmonis TaxID=2951408 RepID=A0A9X2J0V1_9NOCA|nr:MULTISPECIES: SRPBCC family protein [Nocardia]MCM6777415.1 SRPBCC family protein [Nocardia pulmonis]MCM6790300.1 SRPBCC family protein [Nocardia sp. CDC159]